MRETELREGLPDLCPDHPGSRLVTRTVRESGADSHSTARRTLVQHSCGEPSGKDPGRECGQGLGWRQNGPGGESKTGPGTCAGPEALLFPPGQKRNSQDMDALIAVGGAALATGFAAWVMTPVITGNPWGEIHVLAICAWGALTGAASGLSALLIMKNRPAETGKGLGETSETRTGKRT